MKYRTIAILLTLALLAGAAPVSGSAVYAAEKSEAEELAFVEPEDDELDMEDEDEAASEEGVVVSYEVNCANHGWLGTVKNGDTAAVEGESAQIEAIRIRLENKVNPAGAPVKGGIRYSVHCEEYGWMEPCVNGLIAGTEGQDLRMEAIRIKLTGDIAQYYDVYYRVFCENYGTMDWVKNGEIAGTVGEGLSLEAIEIVLEEKTPGNEIDEESSKEKSDKKDSDEKSDKKDSDEELEEIDEEIDEESCPGAVLGGDGIINYEACVEGYGWMDTVCDGAAAGTVDEGARLEAVRIWVNNPVDENGKRIPGEIQYQAHIEQIGWADWNSTGVVAGTEAVGLRMEAIRMKLDGELAEKYDVWYRAHVQSIGWMGWVKNGAEAGASGLYRRMEALEIRLLEKGSNAPGSTENGFLSREDFKGVVVLDAGNLTEGTDAQRVTLDVAEKLEEELKSRGYYVGMAQDREAVLYDDVEGAIEANDYEADVFLSIQASADEDTSVKGAKVICCTETKSNKDLYSASSALSEAVLEEYVKATGMESMGVEERNDLAGIKEAKFANAIINCGYVSNSSENMLMHAATYRAKMAAGIANGIDKYLGNK